MFIIPFTLQWIMLFEVDCKLDRGVRGGCTRGMDQVRQEGKNDSEAHNRFEECWGEIKMYEFRGRGHCFISHIQMDVNKSKELSCCLQMYFIAYIQLAKNDPDQDSRYLRCVCSSTLWGFNQNNRDR